MVGVHLLKQEQITELHDLMAKVVELEDMKGQLEEKLWRIPYKSPLLGLTEDEVGIYLADRALVLVGEDFSIGIELLELEKDQLAEYVIDLANRLREQEEENKPKLSMPMPRVLKKVTVIGLLPDQARNLEGKLEGRAEFNFIDKNRCSPTAIPPVQDIIVVSAEFVSVPMKNEAKKRAEGGTQVIMHRGGISLLAQKLKEIL